MNQVLIKRPRLHLYQEAYKISKRAMDVLICLVILPVFLPVMLVCAAAIYLNSPGPVLFIQERIGKGGRSFRIYKFRTLRLSLDQVPIQSFMQAYVRGEVDCGNDGKKVFKPIPPDQFFSVGRWLRKTSLDELPQIVNVIKGEMSIIGPRPNVRNEVNAYFPWHHERLEVLPGITGLAQVHGRSCIDFNTLVRFDIQYIENRSLALDLKILWWTFLSVFTKQGAW